MVKEERWRSWGRRRLAGGALLLLAAGVTAAAAVAATTSYSLTPIWLGSADTPTTIAEPLAIGGPFNDGDAITAASSNGDATAAWIDSQGELVVSSLDPSTGAWSMGDQLGPGSTTAFSDGASGPTDAPGVAVAMDAAGDAVVAWWNGNDEVDYSYELGGGASPDWSAPASLGVSDAGNVDDIQLAMNSGGDAAIAVGYGNNSGDPVALATANAVDSFAFTTPVALTQPSGGSSADLPRVAIDGAGDVLTTWVESGLGNPTPYASLEAYGASTPSAATAVSGDADASLTNGGVTLAMNTSGEAALAWSDGTSIYEADATPAQLHSAGGPQFDAAATVTPIMGAEEIFPSVALSDDGTTALAWNDLNPSPLTDAIIRPAAKFGTTDWSTTADLEANESVCSGSPNPCADPTTTLAPQVAFEQGNNAVVLWGGSDYGVYSVTSVGDSFASLSSASTLEYGSSVDDHHDRDRNHRQHHDEHRPGCEHPVERQLALAGGRRCRRRGGELDHRG